MSRLILQILSLYSLYSIPPLGINSCRVAPIESNKCKVNAIAYGKIVHLNVIATTSIYHLKIMQTVELYFFHSGAFFRVPHDKREQSKDSKCFHVCLFMLIVLYLFKHVATI